jgi:hypothetical protein
LFHTVPTDCRNSHHGLRENRSSKA